MRLRKILPILFIALLIAAPSDAQRRRGKNKKVKQKEEKIVETPQQILYKTLLPSTQKIMFVDSVDATKDDFMKHIKLSHEIGNIVAYNDFFNKKDTIGCYGFINGFENKYYFSIPNKNGAQLFTADNLDNKWKNHRDIAELNNDSYCVNHPYMMTDGLTLYFSAKRKDNNLGGYDIYVTSFDTESGKFLEPQNIGLPFNSDANDYMFVIDDVNNVGWFVTDRNKKDGHVTVYTFIPNDIRTNYDIEALGEEKVNSYARIDKYSDTWTSKAERNKILKRIRTLLNKDIQIKKSETLHFAINNNTVYDEPSDFKSKDARVLFDKLIKCVERMEAIENDLADKRVKYHVSPESTRSRMAPNMIKMEKEYEHLLDEVKQMRKDIINLENRTLNIKN